MRSATTISIPLLLWAWCTMATAQEASALRVGVDAGLALYTGQGTLTFTPCEASFDQTSGIALLIDLAGELHLGGEISPLQSSRKPLRVELRLGYGVAAVSGSYTTIEDVVTTVDETSTVARGRATFDNEGTLRLTRLKLAPSIRYDISSIFYAGLGGDIDVTVGTTTELKKTIVTRVIEAQGVGLVELAFAGGDADDPYTRVMPSVLSGEVATLTVGATAYIGAEFPIGKSFSIGPRIGYTLGLTPSVSAPSFKINALWGLATLRYQL
jgi:hypothetical protein